MSRTVSWLILASLVLTTTLIETACASAAPAPGSGSSGDMAAPAPAPHAPEAPGAAQGGVDRMMVRTAHLRLVVVDVDQVLSAAGRMAEEMGGYVVSSESREQEGDRVGKATLRVPGDRLDEALGSIKEMATRVRSESTTAKDVTEEFVDQEARLGAFRAMEEQYLQLLKSAHSVDDVLRVQQALGQVREQIERTQGRMLYLQRSAETAAITLELSMAGAARPLSGGGWDALDTFSEALQGLVGAGMVLASLAIWVAVFAPIWLPGLVMVRWWRRRGGRGAPPRPPAASGTGPTP